MNKISFIDEKIIKDGNFTWREALTLREFDMMAFPTFEQYKNIIYIASVMEKIRTILGSRPLTIHSWIRPKYYNEFIKGSWNSGHLYGMAVDFSHSVESADSCRSKLLPHLEKLDIRMEDMPGSNWVHVDSKGPLNGKRFFKP